MEGEVIRSLFRALMRSARDVDRIPMAKALIARAPKQYYDFSRGQWMVIGSSSRMMESRAMRRRMAEDCLDRAEAALLGGGLHYRPGGSAVARVRAEFDQTGIDDEHRDVRIDAGLMALKKLSNVMALAQGKHRDSYGDEGGGGGGERWIPLPDVEESFANFKEAQQLGDGKILVAHPLLSGSFNKTVVLICHYDPVRGAHGIVMNARKIGYLSVAHLLGMTRPVSSKASWNRIPVYWGGPVGSGPDYGAEEGAHDNKPLRSLNVINVIHRYKHLEGAREVAPGIYLNFDAKAAVDQIQRGEVLLEDMLFFGGYAGWGVHQLEGELSQHSWFLGGGDSLSDLLSEIIEKRKGERDADVVDGIGFGGEEEGYALERRSQEARSSSESIGTTELEAVSPSEPIALTPSEISARNLGIVPSPHPAGGKSLKPMERVEFKELGVIVTPQGGEDSLSDGLLDPPGYKSGPHSSWETNLGLGSNHQGKVSTDFNDLGTETDDLDDSSESDSDEESLGDSSESDSDEDSLNDMASSSDDDEDEDPDAAGDTVDRYDGTDLLVWSKVLNSFGGEFRHLARIP